MSADLDDHEPRGRPWDSLLGGVVRVGQVIACLAALVILFLAFRGPSGHPPASTAAASPDSPSAAAPPAAGSQGASARSAKAPPATSAARPSPSPTASVAQPAGPLGAQAQAYLKGRRGTVEAEVFDLSTGQQWTLGQQAPQAAAGAVKLEVLEGVLNQRMDQHVVLSLTEQELTPPMIEQGDSDAVTTLWTDVGGAAGMRTLGHKAGLARTTPSTCLQCPGTSAPGWALTTTTPQDQVTLLRQLAQPSKVIDANGQKYALHLLQNVIPSQRWGASSGVAAGVTVSLDNGTLALKGSADWQVNSAGWVSGDGRDYLIAMLSTGNPTEQYGIATLSHLGGMVWTALAPRR